MSKKVFLASGVLCAIGFLLNGQRPVYSPAHRIAAAGAGGLLRDASLEQRVRTALTGAPLSFEENLGQANARMKFVARGGNFMLGLAPDEADLHIHTPHIHEKRPAQLDPEGLGWADAMAASGLVRVEFAHSNPGARLEGLDPQPGSINYFKGSNPNGWRRNVPHFDRVRYEGLYPGIDAVFYGDRREMEFDFVVAPGADPSAIRMHVEGAGSVELTDAGGLVARTAAGEVTLLPPQLYQKNVEEQRKVAGRYVWRAPGEIGFEVAAYNHAEALVIDPQVSLRHGGARQATKGTGRGPSKNGEPPDTPPPTGGSVSLSTFLGGSYEDSIESIAVSAATGHIYVTGFEDSYDFPETTEGGYGPLGTPNANCQIPQSPCGDAFVAEFNVSTITAPVLVTSTVIGGSNDDVAWGIALDGNDDPYIVGQTDSLDYPTTANAIQCVLGEYGCEGGTIDYPVTNSGCGTAAQPRACHHVFVSVFSPDLSQLLFSTYLAGSDDDEGYAIAVDGNGNAFLTGAAGEYFPTQVSETFCEECFPFQEYYNGAGDAFVAGINNPVCPAGTICANSGALMFATYLGGYETDAGLAIALDGNDDVFVGGVTFSGNDPNLTFSYPCDGCVAITGGSLQQTSNDSNTCGPGYVFACGDGFFVEMNEFGQYVSYGTYLGGSNADQVNAIALDLEGDAFVTGQTESGDFQPVTVICPEYCEGQPFQANNNGGNDAFVVSFYYQCTTECGGGDDINYATYLGGSNDDIGLGIAADENGDSFVTGSTASGTGADPGFPLANALQTQSNAQYYSSSAFVTVVNNLGSGLLFSSYYGGLYDYYGNSPTDVGTSITLDSNGVMYVAGRSTSYGTTGNTLNQYGEPGLCFINQIPGANADQLYYNDNNGFVAIINPTNSASACFSPALKNATSATTSTPKTFNFGSSLSNTPNQPYPAAPQVLTIYNQGSAQLTSTITVTGANAGDFPETDNCATVAGGGASCQITIQFTPTASTVEGPAMENAQLVIQNSANCPTAMSCTAALTGIALPPATVTLTPSPVNFMGTTQVNSSSSPVVVTFTNTSTTSYVDLSSPTPVMLAGANPGEFTINSNYCYPNSQIQDNGSTCTVYVSFTPNTVPPGGRSATLVFTDDGVASPQSVMLNATSVFPPAVVSVPPLSLLFGPQVQGTTSTAQTVTITNSATAPAANLVVTQPLTFTGVNLMDFAATGCATAVAPGNTCVISVTFTPQAGTAGNRMATLQLASNATNGTQTIGVSGTDLALPTLTLNPAPPSPLTFPNQVLMTMSAPMNVTLTNTSASSPLTLANVALTGAEMNDFAIASNGCGSSLAAGANCVVSLTFTPQATGARTITLQFTDNASGTPASPQNVTINGTGVSPPTANLTAAITFTTSQAINTTSPSMAATLSNTGGAPLPITNITTTGDFAVLSSNCGTSLAAGSNCTINVTFTPLASGTLMGTLVVTDSVGMQTTTLTGTGVTPPTAILSTNNLTFGTQAVGVPIAGAPITLMNTGGSPLNIATIAASGDFSEMDTCVPSVPAGGMCMITVTFTPSGAGVRNGSIVIVDNAANSPQTITLSGTGSTTVPGFALSAPLYFGAVLEGTTSAAQTITITNSGGATLNVTSVTASAQFNVSANTCGMVAIGSSCMVSVTFTPTMTGLQSGTLTFMDNAPPGTQTVSLSGIGATVNLAPTAGSSATLTVTPGDTATYPVNASSTPGLVVTLSLSCTSTAPYSICTVSPTQVTLGGASVPVITVTVQTNCNTSLTAPPSLGPPPILPAPFAEMWVGMLVLYLMLRRVIPKPWLVRAAPALLLLMLAITWAGCVNNPPPAIPGAPTTPAGIYNVTVTATGMNGVNVTKILTLTLRVI